MEEETTSLAQALAGLLGEIHRRTVWLVEQGETEKAEFVMKRMKGMREELAMALVVLKAYTKP